MRMKEVELICFGNELLIGKTVNTNANWLGHRISLLGGQLRRIITIPDDKKIMIQTVIEAISRKPAIIITTGGMGPTFDDFALEAIAKAIKKDLEFNEKALEFIKERIANVKKTTDIELHLSNERKRMAMLPKGGKPLRNREGTAPGVLVIEKGIMIFSIPGVPKEMKSIFENEISTYFENESDNHYLERSLTINHVPESELGVAITPIRKKYPNIYFKTHPRSYTSTEKTRVIEVEIHLSTISSVTESIKIDNAIEELVKVISGLKGVHGEKPKITYGIKKKNN
ncbi:MAG: competence damage-inducible protein A [Asgard group archaeon]|nr:competence damage-inducible protein A [Asgard group archaeon]